MTTDSERLERVISFAGVNQAQMARALAVPAQLLNDVLHKRKGLSRRLALVINERYGFSLRWLLTGDGDPWDSGTTTPAPESANVVRRLCCEACGAEVVPGDYSCGNCLRVLVWPDKV
jgi:hypothetical protein